MTGSGKVFVRARFVWVAWYPKRGRGCTWMLDRNGGFHLSIGLGPLFVGLGSGTPRP